MNRTYSLVWNHCLGTWSVTSEHARKRSKGAGAVLAAALLLPSLSMAASLPTGGQVVSGVGQITTPAANQMQIQQTSQKLAVNWQSFDIAEGHKVTFNQPSREAVALNRVLGADGSKIMGQLESNGQVFLVNPNGVVFSQNAEVNVGGLVASTLELSVKDFEASNYQFKGDGTNAGVINHGSLTAADGGAIALLGGTVSNQGIIVAKEGSVALAAGNQVTIDFAGDGLLNLQVDQGTAHALVENRQFIKADGGQVLLTAAAADAVVKAVVNNDGIIQAHSLAEKDGKILLLADMQHGELTAAGSLEANFVETSAASVTIDKNLKVDTQGGEWLIDPVDITIDQSKATAIQTALDSGDVTVTTTNGAGWAGQINDSGTDKGDIHVNANITYTQNKLTLNADNNIHIKANINASSTAKLAFEYGQGAVAAGNTADYHLNNGAKINLPAGQNFTTKLGSDGATRVYTVITQLGAANSNSTADLQGINGGLSGNYVLGADINASGTGSWNAGLGFSPLGSGTTKFTGRFDGLGHHITGLMINRPTQASVGLFGATQGATLRNVGLLGGSVVGESYVGGLVGHSHNNDIISNTYNTGSVASVKTAGSWFAVGAGGLIGTLSGSLSDSYATGSVTGDTYVGGLVGRSYGAITNSYATGAVSGDPAHDAMMIGGLVGYNLGGSIRNAYATGTVSGNDEVGGLVGYSSGTIEYTYALGTVSGTTRLGALVGNQSIYNGSVESSFYAISNASDNIINTGSAFTGYVNGTAKYFHELTQLATFNGWDIDAQSGTEKVWRWYEGSTTPLLRSFLKPLTVTPTNLAAKTYDRSVAQGTFTYTSSVSGAQLLGSARYRSSSPNAGTYSTAAGNLVLSGLYSGQQGYDISYSLGASLNITPKALTISGVTASNKIYDGNSTAQVSGGSLSGFVGSETVTFTMLNGGFADPNVGNNKDVSLFITLDNGTNGGLASNYTVTQPTLKANITQRGLIVTANNATKTYNGLSFSGGNDVTYSGFVNGEDASVLTGSLSYGGTAQGALDAGSYALSVSGLTSVNYAISYAPGTLLINKAALTVTANDATKTYDGLAFGGGNGVTHSGFVNGESASVLGGVLTYGGTAQGAIDAGTYALTVDGLTSGNYAISYTPGTLLINKAALTVTANDATKIYDGLAFGGGNDVTHSGFVNGENASVLSGVLTYGGTAQGAIDAGTYALTVDGLTSGNYAISYAPGTLLINKAALTVTANDATKTYDGLAFGGGNDVTHSGFVNGESASVLGGVLTYGGTAQGAIDAGTYALTVDGLTSDNYAISYAPGTLLINKAALTVTANDTTKIYDGLAFGGGNDVTHSGFVNGESASVLGGVLTYGGTAQGAIDAGTYTLTVDGLTSGNYAISYAPGTLLINKAALTVTANDATKIYDGLAFGGGNDVTHSGFVNGESASVLGGALTYGGTAQGAIDAGTYALTVDGLTSGNYAISYAPGTLLINKAALTVTANDARKTYDGLIYNGIAGVDYVGFVNGETSVVLDGALSYQSGSTAGTHNIKVSGLTSGNYTISYTLGTLLIDRAAVTVTGILANDKTYDGTLDASLNTDGIRFAGLVGDDELSLANATGYFSDKHAGSAKQVNISGITLEGADVGNYVLTASTASATADIHRKALTITADTVKVLQGKLASLSYIVQGLVEGDELSTVSLTSDGLSRSAEPGNYAIVASNAQGADVGNYDIAYQNGTLEVEDTLRTNPAYLSVRVSAVQLPERSFRLHGGQAVEPSESQSMQFAALNDLPLIVENGGLRLPEGF